MCVLQTRTPPCGQAVRGCFRCFTVIAHLRDCEVKSEKQPREVFTTRVQGVKPRPATCTVGVYGSLLKPDTVVDSLPQQPDPACHQLTSTGVNGSYA